MKIYNIKNAQIEVDFNYGFDGFLNSCMHSMGKRLRNLTEEEFYSICDMYLNR